MAKNVNKLEESHRSMDDAMDNAARLGAAASVMGGQIAQVEELVDGPRSTVEVRRINKPPEYGEPATVGKSGKSNLSVVLKTDNGAGVKSSYGFTTVRRPGSKTEFEDPQKNHYRSYPSAGPSLLTDKKPGIEVNRGEEDNRFRIVLSGKRADRAAEIIHGRAEAAVKVATEDHVRDVIGDKVA